MTDPILAERPDNQPTIVVASHNAHKLPEVVQAIDLPGYRFISLDQLGFTEQADETAPSFAGNAWIKAGFAFARTKQACLADDSGLEVDALGGAPGVYSSRYAGSTATDQQNLEKLLAALDGVPDERRTARFVCELAYIAKDGSQLSARGVCEGRIAASPRGANGFGYDPVFIPDASDSGQTMAELTPGQKAMISHRGQALARLHQKVARQWLKGAISAGEADGQGGHLADAKAHLAVFDFDGTLLDGASPVRLVRRLLLRRILPMSVGLRVILWAAKYKFRLPVAQEQVRGYIFGGLSKLSADEVNDLMQDLYHTELKPLFRQEGLAELEAARRSGMRIVVVSASFNPIIQQLAAELNADFYVSTEMEIVDGHYTGRVAKVPPEGINKLIQLRQKADDMFGEGGWVLDSAYGDHDSDTQLLSAAMHPYAIDPDAHLKALAKQLGWPIRYWK